ncbi:hypothetical protein MNB_SV-5-1153 [hydrothermal vent metagenome]|uniref:Endonuclease/exonuclease/phosphatase domain-containing protein n=1 Tax=hydrothermal vent metagenome TaxID=652676 RepID=A0A1W1EDH0_9ZZZZ
MFIPSIIHHKSYLDNCEVFLPDTFSIVSWNVHKNNNKDTFKRYLDAKVKSYKLDMLIFQEAIFTNINNPVLTNFAFDAAANLQIKNNFFGVLTASKVRSVYAKAYLSKDLEAYIGTHKSMLLSTYEFKDRSKILILNVHAINFRENESYSRELERFFSFIESYDGAMIICGDFNSWNRTRLDKLNIEAKKLNLKVVNFKNSSFVKSFAGNSLDFIFYKGLELLESSVEVATKHSDHNPLFAKFKKI